MDASCKGTSSFMSNTLVIPKQDLLMVYILYRSNKSIGTDEWMNEMYILLGKNAYFYKRDYFAWK